MGKASCDIPAQGFSFSGTAAAVVTEATRTGAFKDVQAREVLTSEQLTDVVALARSTEGV